ncbi:MAG: YDG domain-containing protein, partial [Nitrospirota bacterium]
TFTDSTGNYTDQSGSVAIVIAKAEATVSVSGYSGTYDAAAHGASGTATGIGGVDLSAGLNLGATFTNVPGGTATWTFTDSTGNYTDQSGSVAISITALGITGSFTVANKTYDGSSAATVQSRTLAGVLGGDAGSVSLSGGTAAFNTAAAGNGKTVTLTGATLTGTAAGNYSLSSVGTTTANIAKANAIINVSGYSGVYDGAAHGAIGTAVGLNSPPFPIQSYGTVLDVSTDGITNNSSVGLSGVNGFRYANTVFPADQEGQVTLTGA